MKKTWGTILRYKKYLITLILIFSFFFVFFAKLHPLILFDSDDWVNIAQAKELTPEWGSFNPGRIFPGIFMPMVTAVGAYFINSFVDDFLISTSIAYAIVVSFFITIYAGCFMCLLRKRFSLRGGGKHFRNDIISAAAFSNI